MFLINTISSALSRWVLWRFLYAWSISCALLFFFFLSSSMTSRPDLWSARLFFFFFLCYHIRINLNIRGWKKKKGHQLEHDTLIIFFKYNRERKKKRRQRTPKEKLEHRELLFPLSWLMSFKTPFLTQILAFFHPW